MSPINQGEAAFTVRNLARHAADSIDALVKSVMAEAKRAEQRRRTLTDIAFREFHAEAFGTWEGKQMPTFAQHAMARLVFDIPNLTETPVDRWMERFRGRYHRPTRQAQAA